MNDEEPLFLKGVSSRSGAEMSPIKIVKNPDGSMQRAAMTQVRSRMGTGRAFPANTDADAVLARSAASSARP